MGIILKSNGFDFAHFLQVSQNRQTGNLMKNTENKGILKTWKDNRGFGFIKPDDGSEDIFIHISALRTIQKRPYKGDVIFYQIERSEDRKSKAINARVERSESYTNFMGSKWFWIVASILVLVGTLIILVMGLTSLN